MAYSAVLDANVLHPQILCDLLLRLAEHDVFRPLWSAEILEETVGSILRRRQDLDPASLRKRMAAMNEAFPDACVSGFEHLIPTMRDMGEDARTGGFPPHVAPRFEIDVKTADQFLVQQWWLEPRLVASVIIEQSKGTRRPHIDPPRLLEALGRVVPEFARLAADSPDFRDEMAGH